MAYTFTHEFDEIEIIVEGRAKYVSGAVDVSYDTYRECGRRWFEPEPAATIDVTNYVDADTEYAVPCEFALHHKTEAYQAILTAIDKCRYTIADACADDFDNLDWEH